MIFQLLPLTGEKISLNLKNFILKIEKVVYRKITKKVEVRVDNKAGINFLTENF